MAKLRFPGKSLKLNLRKRIKYYDGSRTNYDEIKLYQIKKGLNLFNNNFGFSDEDDDFDGFGTAHYSLEENLRISRKLQNQDKKSIRKEKSEIGEDSGEESEQEEYLKNEEKDDEVDDAVISEKFSDSCIKSLSNGEIKAERYGQFVLPTRSVRSSRIIKPNVRLLDYASCAIEADISKRVQKVKSNSPTISNTNPEDDGSGNERISRSIALYTDAITEQGRPPVGRPKKVIPCEVDSGKNPKEHKVKEKIEKLLRSAWDDRLKNPAVPSKPPDCNMKQNAQALCSSKNILRKARLNLNKRTLQKIRHPSSMQKLISNEDPFDDRKCGLCLSVGPSTVSRYGVSCCPACHLSISMAMDEGLSTHECTGGTGECQLIGLSMYDRCQACWQSRILLLCSMPDSIHDRILKKLPAYLREKISSNSENISKRLDTYILDDDLESTIEFPGGWKRKNGIVISPFGEKIRSLAKLKQYLKKKRISGNPLLLFGGDDLNNSSYNISMNHSPKKKNCNVTVTDLPNGWSRRSKRFGNYQYVAVCSAEGKYFTSRFELQQFFEDICEENEDISNYFPIDCKDFKDIQLLSDNESTDSSGSDRDSNCSDSFEIGEGSICLSSLISSAPVSCAKSSEKIIFNSKVDGSLLPSVNKFPGDFHKENSIDGSNIEINSSLIESNLSESIYNGGSTDMTLKNSSQLCNSREVGSKKFKKNCDVNFRSSGRNIKLRKENSRNKKRLISEDREISEPDEDDSIQYEEIDSEKPSGHWNELIDNMLLQSTEPAEKDLCSTSSRNFIIQTRSSKSSNQQPENHILEDHVLSGMEQVVPNLECADNFVKPPTKMRTVGKLCTYTTDHFGHGWVRRIKWNPEGIGRVSYLTSPTGEKFVSPIELLAYFKKDGQPIRDLSHYFPTSLVRDLPKENELDQDTFNGNDGSKRLKKQEILQKRSQIDSDSAIVRKTFADNTNIDDSLVGSMSGDAGPRVKNVCRSRAQAVGMPRAVFSFSAKEDKLLPPRERRGSLIQRKTIARKPLKTIWCHKCTGCLTPNCRECIHCLNMKKYGGSGTIKKPCMERKCLNPRRSFKALRQSKNSAPEESSKNSDPDDNITVNLNKVDGENVESNAESELGGMEDVTTMKQENVFIPKQKDSGESEQKDRVDSSSGKEFIPGALVNVDYWPSNDPETTLMSGFPIISSTPLNCVPLCFRCGSAGMEELLFCIMCCEGVHPFCLEEGECPQSEEDSLMWVCRGCQVCHICGVSSLANQVVPTANISSLDSILRCSGCFKYYHLECLGPSQQHLQCPLESNGSWLCVTCTKCQSCGSPNVSDWIEAKGDANLSKESHLSELNQSREIEDYSSRLEPFCSRCLELQQCKNFCTLCCACYEDEDFESKMMECGRCKEWIHAHCEGLSDEGYQILSYLPDSVEFVCRLCLKDESASWLNAVNQERMTGLNKVLENLMLSKYAKPILDLGSNKIVIQRKNVEKKTKENDDFNKLAKEIKIAKQPISNSSNENENYQNELVKQVVGPKECDSLQISKIDSTFVEDISLISSPIPKPMQPLISNVNILFDKKSSKSNELTLLDSVIKDKDIPTQMTDSCSQIVPSAKAQNIDHVCMKDISIDFSSKEQESKTPQNLNYVKDSATKNINIFPSRHNESYLSEMENLTFKTTLTNLDQSATSQHSSDSNQSAVSNFRVLRSRSQYKSKINSIISSYSPDKCSNIDKALNSDTDTKCVDEELLQISRNISALNENNSEESDKTESLPLTHLSSINQTVSFKNLDCNGLPDDIVESAGNQFNDDLEKYTKGCYVQLEDISKQRKFANLADGFECSVDLSLNRNESGNSNDRIKSNQKLDHNSENLRDCDKNGMHNYESKIGTEITSNDFILNQCNTQKIILSKTDDSNLPSCSKSNSVQDDQKNEFNTRNAADILNSTVTDSQMNNPETNINENPKPSNKIDLVSLSKVPAKFFPLIEAQDEDKGTKNGDTLSNYNECKSVLDGDNGFGVPLKISMTPRVSKDIDDDLISSDTSSCCGSETDIESLTEESVDPVDLIGLKKKVCDMSYDSVLQFHVDSLRIIEGFGEFKKKQHKNIKSVYFKFMKDIFPWFDTKTINIFSLINESLPFPPPHTDHNYSIGRSLTNKLSKNRSNGRGSSFLEEAKNFISPTILKTLSDTRKCVLCYKIGDCSVTSSGRLLYLGHDEWIHINCVLWSSEVYEEDDGGLVNVFVAINRGRHIRCNSCQDRGATIGCCHRLCQQTYHFHCARNIGCQFMEDKSIFCPQHRPDLKDTLRIDDFRVERCVHVIMDNDKRRWKKVDGRSVGVTIGSLSIKSLGKIVSGVDCSEALLPYEYSCTRWYWSTKDPFKIVRYTCRLGLVRPQRGTTSNPSDFHKTIDHTLEASEVEKEMLLVKRWLKRLEEEQITQQTLKTNIIPPHLCPFYRKYVVNKKNPRKKDAENVIAKAVSEPLKTLPGNIEVLDKIPEDDSSSNTFPDTDMPSMSQEFNDDNEIISMVLKDLGAVDSSSDLTRRMQTSSMSSQTSPLDLNFFNSYDDNHGIEESSILKSICDPTDVIDKKLSQDEKEELVCEKFLEQCDIQLQQDILTSDKNEMAASGDISSESLSEAQCSLNLTALSNKEQSCNDISGVNVIPNIISYSDDPSKPSKVYRKDEQQSIINPSSQNKSPYDSLMQNSTTHSLPSDASDINSNKNIEFSKHNLSGTSTSRAKIDSNHHVKSPSSDISNKNSFSNFKPISPTGNLEFKSKCQTESSRFYIEDILNSNCKRKLEKISFSPELSPIKVSANDSLDSIREVSFQDYESRKTNKQVCRVLPMPSFKTSPGRDQRGNNIAPNHDEKSASIPDLVEPYIENSLEMASQSEAPLCMKRNVQTVIKNYPLRSGKKNEGCNRLKIEIKETFELPSGMNSKGLKRKWTTTVDQNEEASSSTSLNAESHSSSNTHNIVKISDTQNNITVHITNNNVCHHPKRRKRFHRKNLPQFDGAADESSSEMSDDNSKNIVLKQFPSSLGQRIMQQSLARSNPGDEGPFKCKMCKRLYRTYNSYKFHIQSCNFEIDSSTSSEESFDESNLSTVSKTPMAIVKETPIVKTQEPTITISENLVEISTPSPKFEITSLKKLENLCSSSLMDRTNANEGKENGHVSRENDFKVSRTPGVHRQVRILKRIPAKVEKGKNDSENGSNGNEVFVPPNISPRKYSCPSALLKKTQSPRRYTNVKLSKGSQGFQYRRAQPSPLSAPIQQIHQPPIFQNNSLHMGSTTTGSIPIQVQSMSNNSFGSLPQATPIPITSLQQGSNPSPVNYPQRIEPQIVMVSGPSVAVPQGYALQYVGSYREGNPNPNIMSYSTQPIVVAQPQQAPAQHMMMPPMMNSSMPYTITAPDTYVVNQPMHGMQILRPPTIQPTYNITQMMPHQNVQVNQMQVNPIVYTPTPQIPPQMTCSISPQTRSSPMPPPTQIPSIIPPHTQNLQHANISIGYPATVVQRPLSSIESLESKLEDNIGQKSSALSGSVQTPFSSPIFAKISSPSFTPIPSPTLSRPLFQSSGGPKSVATVAPAVFTSTNSRPSISVPVTGVITSHCIATPIAAVRPRPTYSYRDAMRDGPDAVKKESIPPKSTDESLILKDNDIKKMKENSPPLVEEKQTYRLVLRKNNKSQSSQLEILPLSGPEIPIASPEVKELRIKAKISVGPKRKRPKPQQEQREGKDFYSAPKDITNDLNVNEQPHDLSLNFSPNIKPMTNEDQFEEPKENLDPYIIFEMTSEDGFKVESRHVSSLWQKVFDAVSDARESLRDEAMKIPTETGKSLSGLGMLGLTHNAVQYLLEQLPGAKDCHKYSFQFHRRPQDTEPTLPSPLSGCARCEAFRSRSPYDVFSWLASKHRKMPPTPTKSNCIEEVHGGQTRRGTSLELPMAMRYRHLCIKAREVVGVFRSDIHGRGLFCKRTIEMGEMVIEYAGQVIRSMLCDSREKYYESKGIGCYMFRIDDEMVIDATMHGNAARFINHSCDPNCYSRIVDILGKKHIIIFALRSIVQGEELTYDYKFPLEDDKIPCNCGSRRCRKSLN